MVDVPRFLYKIQYCTNWETEVTKFVVGDDPSDAVAILSDAIASDPVGEDERIHSIFELTRLAEVSEIL